MGWIQPSGVSNWGISEDVPLRVAISDPAPSSGNTGGTTWQIDIGPVSGGIWWSTSGNLTASSEGIRRDTVRTTWSTPADFQGTENPVQLRLTAKATDGEGQTAVDFAEAWLTRTALTSDALWSLDVGPPAQCTGLGLPTPGPWPLNGADLAHLLFLDGQGLLLLGGEELQAVPVGDGPPAPVLWTRTSPSGLIGDHVRVLRRTAPTGGPAHALVGWGDRVERLGPDGTPVSTWLLQEGEVLIDAARMESDLIALVRTAQGEWRMVRYNADSGARIGAITWTPEAAGSAGPQGIGWLMHLDGAPAALETDGRARRWFTEPDGSTGLTTLTLEGEGTVSQAGLLEDGRSWISRQQSRIYDGSAEGDLFHSGQVQAMTTDRANGLIWMLTEDGGGMAWIAVDGQTLMPLSLPTQNVPTTTLQGCVAHNRPGPL
mgnify:CR=1 FL=1